MFRWNGEISELKNTGKLSIAFLLIFNCLHMYRCLLLCLFTDWTYTLRSSTCFNCWCGVGRNDHWCFCAVAILCMCMIKHSLPGSTDWSSLPPPHVSCHVLPLFPFSFSHPPLSYPCILLACINLPWTPTPIIPSPFPLKPSKNNIHSLRTLSR